MCVLRAASQYRGLSLSVFRLSLFLLLANSVKGKRAAPCLFLSSKYYWHFSFSDSISILFVSCLSLNMFERVGG